MSASLFTGVEMAPRDPILGLNEQFQADPNPSKVNLGVGVYTDENGKLPLLACVKEAENLIAESPKPRGYLPIDGIAAYDQAVQSLVFGADSEVVKSGRVVTAQALGGTGALKIGADFLKRLQPGAKVLISDPSWENHRALFEGAGFEVGTYPYYDAANRRVAVQGMIDGLQAAAPGTIVVLHACCHNPTGYDLEPAQWLRVIEAVRARGLVPFLDMAYQGFAEGIAEDGAVIGQFVAAGLDFFVSTSFSKSFSLYGERVGALSIVCSSRDEAQRVQSQLKRVIRTNYSNPPTHGAQVVTMVLSTPALRAQWEQELGKMRVRIRSMRLALVDRLKAAGVQGDLDFITTQRGMFSYSGLNAAQMERLRAEFGIYGVSTGRICVAALNLGNIDYVAKAMAAVMH
ncbi:MAG: aspartate/tyrosine/aromatic aminotransferase [Betaproteobacteria bacterium]|nr:aspartate/tyrosine/aromatic aminotransferase [Betaproteobacteria bacterium]MBU6513702.1 aspartate/tyrosine/aromatic aminotransferase [Betaproteobacteria bacterium]MDE1956414.1 aspartate/tyrosine/aromatic aminotransferase [Betaproteobacteria bacterium]MDE2152740.1 aspartate/tyrosine/aromatic aminotransferase [Betaproteobacteria bacterium]MDE2479207.1 aspartate/tyrosine/aromatic aminotransferase [Betaproteobacteria bacterium]